MTKGSQEEEVKEITDAITTGQVLKWAGIVGGIMTALVSLVWFAASLKGQQELQQADLNQFRQLFLDYKTTADKRMDEMGTKINTEDQVINDLNRKLDVATAILERIDMKLNHP